MIIGLGHRAGTGKNTVGEYLYNWLRSDYPEIKVGIGAFAAPMKALANQMYGWAGLKPAAFYEQNYKEKEIALPVINKSPRQVWIELGNHVRSIYSETWVRMALEEAKKLDVCILPDTRYPNELDAIRYDSGANLVYKVVRNGLVERTDISDCAAQNYERWDGVIENHGNLADLYDNLTPIKTRILRRLNIK